jgi:long-chain acyl-CoA synthetase
MTQPIFAVPAWPLPVPAMRLEAHFGDRVVQCFAERPRSLYQLLAEAVARHPEGEALVCCERRLSYRQLEALVGRMAAGMAGLGIGSADRVALLLGNRIEFVVALFAAARLGAIAVPLNIREQKPELEFVLNNCGARLVFHEAEIADRLPDPKTVPALQHRIEIGAGFDALLKTEPPPAPAAVAEDDTAVILYTSGTTGRPKGAMLSHLNIVHSALHFEICLGQTARDRSIAAVPLSHVTGLIAQIATTIRVAGTLIIMPTFKAAEFLPLAARERVTFALMVPAMYNLCLLQPDFSRHDLSAWRIGGFGGAPMPEATIEALARVLPNLVLTNAYGATETTSPTTIMPPGCTAGRSDSIGRVIPCGELCVMDEHGCEVPPGTAGELWIRGAMVVGGYWNNPEATAKSFTGGFWHSGDIGSVDAEGYVRIFDRQKDMINRGGYKIFSAEVENVLSYHPAVLECAIVPKPCPVLGERVHAFVTIKQAEVTAEELGTYCASQLSDYKVPETFTFQDGPLPRNANGKVIKRTLKERLAAMMQSPS